MGGKTWQGGGPFTVFAPINTKINATIDALPKGTVKMPLKSQNKDKPREAAV